MAGLKISVEKSEGSKRATVRCKGSIDAHTFEELDEALLGLIDEGVPYIIADLRHVNYLSSAGIGVLIGAKSEAEGQGGNLVLMHVIPEVEEVLKMMGFDSMFDLVSSEQEAIKSLGIGGGISAGGGV